MEHESKSEPGAPSELLDHLLVSDPSIGKLNDKIVTWQNRLKAAITRKEYRIYLRIEGLVNERLSLLMERAWAVGMKHGRPKDLTND